LCAANAPDVFKEDLFVIGGVFICVQHLLVWHLVHTVTDYVSLM